MDICNKHATITRLTSKWSTKCTDLMTSRIEIATLPHSVQQKREDSLNSTTSYEFIMCEHCYIVNTPLLLYVPSNKIEPNKTYELFHKKAALIQTLWKLLCRTCAFSFKIKSAKVLTQDVCAYLPKQAFIQIRCFFCAFFFYSMYP